VSPTSLSVRNQVGLEGGPSLGRTRAGTTSKVNPSKFGYSERSALLRIHLSGTSCYRASRKFTPKTPTVDDMRIIKVRRRNGPMYDCVSGSITFTGIVKVFTIPSQWITEKETIEGR
jgi:hypothetical protein